MTNEFVKTIFARRSIRNYTEQPVSEGNLKTLLEAAMAAPSASNRKPWHFVVVNERETLDRLADAHSYGKMLHDAPLCISVCGDTNVSERFWVQDCSAATENLLLAATALGLGAVWLGVFPRQERVSAIRKLLGLPAHIMPLCLVSIGYPAEQKPRANRYDSSRIHHNRW